MTSLKMKIIKKINGCKKEEEKINKQNKTKKDKVKKILKNTIKK